MTVVTGLTVVTGFIVGVGMHLVTGAGIGFSVGAYTGFPIGAEIGTALIGIIDASGVPEGSCPEAPRAHHANSTNIKWGFILVAFA